MIEPLLASESLAVAGAAAPFARFRPRTDDDASLRVPVLLPDTCPRMSAALARESVERNVFHEPWMIRAAAPLAANARIHTFVASRGQELCGLLPVSLPRSRLSLPVGSVWAHPHCFDATPVIREGAEDFFFDALFDWLARHGVAVLRWQQLALEGEIPERLFGYLRRTGRTFDVVGRLARPLLDAATSTERDVISRNRQRGVRRCLRRLGELGSVSFRTLEVAEESEAWAQQFLRLEASGWKGERGTATALACREREQAFFLNAFVAAAQQDQLLAHALELDGTPIAMAVNFRRGDAVWAYKTAYDARYARFGPGALVEVEGTRAMLADPTINWVDSCSDGNNQLLTELWRGKRHVGEALIAVRPGRGPALAYALAAAKAKTKARQHLKNAYRYVRRWR